MLRAAAAIEEEGIPTVAIVGSGFDALARAIAKAMDKPHQPIAVYPAPGIIMTDAEDVFQRKVLEVVLPVIIEALNTPDVARRASTVVEQDADQFMDPRSTVFSGDFDDIQEHFHEQGWSDGLPVVPPTIERVENFLRHTSRDAEEVLGILLPERRKATIWNVAVNGVMAGCRPEYMPVLIAIVEAIADPMFRLQDSGSTPGWEPLITVSGPIVDELQFNYKHGAMRIGRRANTSIGRFLRLYMRNIAGFRIPPGVHDGAAIGSSFNVVMAESNWGADTVSWPTTREELGFDRNDNIVMLQSVRSMSPPIYSSGDTPDEHLAALAEVAIGTLASTVHRAYVSGQQYPLIFMNTAVADVFHKAGVGRNYVREYLAKHCWIPLREVDLWAERVGRAAEGVQPKDGAERMGIKPEMRNGEPWYPMFITPQNIVIIIGGNPGRNQSRMYFDNGSQGARVVRKIER